MKSAAAVQKGDIVSVELASFLRSANEEAIEQMVKILGAL